MCSCGLQSCNEGALNANIGYSARGNTHPTPSQEARYFVGKESILAWSLLPHWWKSCFLLDPRQLTQSRLRYYAHPSQFLKIYFNEGVIRNRYTELGNYWT